jgi:hypothetical protein
MAESLISMQVQLRLVGGGWTVVDDVYEGTTTDTIGVVVDDQETSSVVAIHAPLYDVEGKERLDESLLIALPRGMVPR